MKFSKNIFTRNFIIYSLYEIVFADMKILVGLRYNVSEL